MRAPGEAVGLLGLEGAMDELAEAIGMDPIELRRLNEPEQDPEKQVPFSSRRLIAAMDEGCAAVWLGEAATAGPKAGGVSGWWAWAWLLLPAPTC